ncbi:hypothetical protein BT67DRAFT_93256 [Trichocladium antarcticum]|uniref:Uncharacterized protein n=1 Tax=Trichocladium antarcticum TaxID=1450529 RepID=A0AAN6UFU2_9PEZI|nr:hypothetical protein BT67DRAFT_93256 [Trichocladium antarcticum]
MNHIRNLVQVANGLVSALLFPTLHLSGTCEIVFKKHHDNNYASFVPRHKAQDQKDKCFDALLHPMLRRLGRGKPGVSGAQTSPWSQLRT